MVSLIQKLCENIGAMSLQHDRASVTWIGTFLQMQVKELEDKVAQWGWATCGWGCPVYPDWRDRLGQPPLLTMPPRPQAIQSRREQS